MEIELPDTTTKEITSSLQQIQETTAQTTGRVLTLLISVTSDDSIEDIVGVVEQASREHPARVIVLIDASGKDSGQSTTSRIDARIDSGGETGASEMITIRMHGEVANHPAAVVTPLLLPDTPIVAWWPATAPECPAQHPLGRIAHRRITDISHSGAPSSLESLRQGYSPGDSDFAWARITPWRGIVASALDVYPREKVLSARIVGDPENSSIDLAAGWLASRLGIKVTRVNDDSIAANEGLSKDEACQLTLHRKGGDVTITTQPGSTISVEMPGRPDTPTAMNGRTPADCLAEDLRHLTTDDIYAEALAATDNVITETAASTE